MFARASGGFSKILKAYALLSLIALEKEMCFSMRTNMRILRNACGFTLIELMVTIGVLAILAGIAVPNFLGWLPKARLKSAARELYSDIQLAKISAIESGVRCAISFNPTGYVLFLDENNNLALEDSETVIKEKPGNDAGWAGHKGVSVSDSDLPVITFMANGIPTDGAGGFVSGDVKLVDTENNKRNVEIFVTGTPKIIDPDNP